MGKLSVAGPNELVCERMRSLLPGLLAGDLEGRDMRTVSGHIEGCYDCREERRLLENAMDALRSLPESERVRLREAALREIALDDPPRRSRAVPVVLAVLAFLAVFAVVRAKRFDRP